MGSAILAHSGQAYMQLLSSSWHLPLAEGRSIYENRAHQK